MHNCALFIVLLAGILCELHVNMCIGFLCACAAWKFKSTFYINSLISFKLQDTIVLLQTVIVPLVKLVILLARIPMK